MQRKFVFLAGILIFALLPCANAFSKAKAEKWQKIKIGKTSFDFPQKFKKYAGEDLGSDEVQVSTFTCDEGGRGAFFRVFDFAKSVEPPEFKDSFKGEINDNLTSLDAQNFEWLATGAAKNVIWANFKYSVGQGEQTGFCWAFRQGRHIEMLLLLGISQSYSADFVNRVRKSIKVSK